MWPTFRAQRLTQQFLLIGAKPKLRFTFVPSIENEPIQYFPEGFIEIFSPLVGSDLEYVPISEGLADIDVVIVSCHGSDFSPQIWRLRQNWPRNTLLAVWFWDNHLAHLNNFKTALTADIVFPSHKYSSGYLANPGSALGWHIPSCSAQWTIGEASDVFQANVRNTRSNRLLVNYVDYHFSWRHELLWKLKEQLVDAEVLLMDPDDRSRYFTKSRKERMNEWLGHKATIIIPVQNDLSTRVFDALLAGLVLLVPEGISDFDEVIPLEQQQELGIVRLHDLEIPTIQAAAIRAIEIFDAAGETGMCARHDFVINNHMLHNRVAKIIRCIRHVAVKQSAVVFGDNEQGHVGLHFAN